MPEVLEESRQVERRLSRISVSLVLIGAQGCHDLQYLASGHQSGALATHRWRPEELRASLPGFATQVSGVHEP